MLLLRFIARRIPYVIPQLFGITLVSFFMVKLIPGDPAVMMLGPMASERSLTALREKMGLSKPLWQQFLYYIRDVIHGDFGTSWQTTRPVTEDLFQRFPATLELVTIGLLLALIIGFPLGVAAARLRSGPVRKFADYYGLLAGAMPDFWLALVLIYIFYTQLGWIAAPLGRIDMAVVPPKTVTGSLVIDSLLTGNFEALSSSFGHLVLPVLTLGIINAGPILKMTQTMVSRALTSEFVHYAEMCGLPRHVVLRQAVRAALPAIVTIVSVLYGFLIGGAVLVEIVFSWGGAGQYAVQGVLNADVNPGWASWSFPRSCR